jgi:uncharacterized membrane protein
MAANVVAEHYLHQTEEAASPGCGGKFMAVAMMSWLIALPLLGIATGMRSMTPMAVLCWFAHLGYLPVEGTWAAWTARLGVAIVFTVLALGEYVGDKLPRTPSRTSPGPLSARVVLAGLAGSICATALGGSGLEGVLLAAAGALVGSFGGFMIRRDVVQKLGCPDWPIAVVEDISAILAAMFALHVITG